MIACPEHMVWLDEVREEVSVIVWFVLIVIVADPPVKPVVRIQLASVIDTNA